MLQNQQFSQTSQFTIYLDLLQHRANQQPKQTAFIFLKNGQTESARLTYFDLKYLAQKIAGHLQTLSQPGDRVLLLYPPGLGFIAAFFGCLYAGAIAIPAYPPRPNRSLTRIESIIADAQATVGLTCAAVMPLLQRRLANNPALKSLQWLVTDELSDDATEFCHTPGLKPESLAFLQYTSGSTGKPKGVMVSHDNLLQNSEYIKQAFALTTDSVSVSWLPHFHDMGLIDGILQPIYTGFLGVLMPSIAFLGRPIQWLQAISRYRATHCGGPNFAYDLCVSKTTSEQRETLDLSCWYSAYNGAEPVRKETLERFSEAFQSCGFQPQFFYPCYGLAESTLMVAGGAVSEKPSCCQLDASALNVHQVLSAAPESRKIRQFISCGYSWLDTQIKIVEPISRQQCSPTQIGEIWIAGGSIAQGYWQRSRETQQTFQAYLADTGEGPFLRTGDLGFIKDGELFVTGRIKDVIIIKGENYYPQDIELTVDQSHPALRNDCGAAFGVEVEGQERLVILQEVERHYLKKLEIEEVVGDICQAVMAEHELQIYDVVLLKTGSLPKTSSGKTQRQTCRQKFLDQTLEAITMNITNPALGKTRIVS